jgi:hypothetical protein
MDVNNKLLSFMLKTKLDESEIKTLIEAYSSFVSVSSKDYYYNQAYLDSYVSDFILARNKVKERQVVLKYLMIPIVLKGGSYRKSKLRITVNNTIVYYKGKFGLKSDFNLQSIKDNSVVIEYFYMTDVCKVQYYTTKLNSPNLRDEIIKETNDFLSTIAEE